MPYKLDECEAAVRCVDCPHCGAEVGVGCINWHGSAARAHKVRVDKYYTDTYGPDSPAVKEMREKAACAPGEDKPK